MGSHRGSCSISSGWMLPKARISFFRLVLFVLVSVLHVPSATGINLKGQKAVFQINKPNEYGTLSPTIKIPPLKEFTLCVDIRLKMKDNKGVVVFSYITDNQRNSKHELGITVTSRKLIFWLFHQKIEVEKILALHRWHSLCLTWHYQSKEALIYVNKTLVHSKTLGKKILGQNGSLVLGRQHRRKVDLLQIELERAFVGDLYLFRLWDFEKDQLSISELNCEDGTIITWDSQQWDFIGKILEYDTTLICCEQVFKPCFKQSEYELHGARISRRLLAHIPSNSTLASSAPNTTPESSTLNMITSLKKTGGNTFNLKSKTRKTTPSTLTSQNTTGNYSIGMPEHQTNATEKITFTAATPSRNTTASTKTPSNLTSQNTTGNYSIGMPEHQTNATEKITFTAATPSRNTTASTKTPSNLTSQNTTGNYSIGMPEHQTNATEKTMFTAATLSQNTTGNYSIGMPEHQTNATEKITFTAATPSRNTTASTKTPSTSTSQNTTGNYSVGMPEHQTNATEKITFTAATPSRNTTASTKTLSTLTSQNTTGNYSIGMPEHQTNATEKTMFTATTPSRNTTVSTKTPSTLTSQNTTEILLEFTDILNATELNVTAVGAIVSNLEEILQMESIDESLATSLVLTISNLLNASPDVVASFSTRLIKSVDAIGLKLDFTTESINITSSSLALAVSKFNSTAFGGSDFSISNITNLQVSLDERTSQGNFAAINLPSSLLNKLTPEEREKASRIQFTFYERSIFFQDPSMENTSVLNSYIIASSVANLSITNLTDPVKLTFRNLKPTKNTSDVQCVFWDFSKNNGTGGWNSAGCYIIVNADNETKCECGHLTHFGILLALSRDFDIDETNNLILTFITYIGCGLSSILLAVTLLTYLTFEKLRRDYPSKILINLCVALLLLNMTFLIDSWISTYNIDGLCIAVAVLLHYFLLVSFTWMSLEAFHMYLSLVKVFNTYVRRYILKFCIIGWGIPIIVISIVLNNPHNYGLGDYDKNSNSTIDTFCWIKEDIVFYIAVVGYFCVMFLLNISMFIVVMNQLYRIKNKKQHQNAQRSILQDMKSVTGLTFLLGITWGFAFFAWGPVNISFMYLFAIFNTLQGAFIFIFHCLTKETVQKQWRRYLCCGKLRLSENSDWSKTATNNIKKMQPLVQSMYSTSNNSLQSNSSLFLAKDYRSYPNVNGAKF
ncbi:adhesion G-protein coupled receptor G2-like isoform X4 [Narcine bancroftii]|uniref:adhesion G-protein coupled receptor G2-like isoform X4 n=1 Tax=Narcine bancroftii TaxID=1343680 RepID=UPI0038322B0B